MSEPERYVSGPDDRLFAAGERHVVAKSAEQATEFLGEPAADVTDTADGIIREWWTTWRHEHVNPMPCPRCGAPIDVPRSTFAPAPYLGDCATESTPGRVPCANCAEIAAAEIRAGFTKLHRRRWWQPRTFSPEQARKMLALLDEYDQATGHRAP